MEEIEVPVEHIQEEIHHHAEHARGTWIAKAALSSAFLAVFAAIASLTAGHHVNEGMMDQIRASDHWGFYQAKSIKASILSARMELLSALQKPTNVADQDKLDQYKKEQEEISEKAKEHEQ